MERLIEEWQCKEHNRNYSNYCLNCDKGYCAICSIDKEKHRITQLFRTVSLEKLRERMKCEESLIITLDNRLKYLHKFQDFIVNLMETNKGLCTLFHQRIVGIITSIHMKCLKVIEENSSKQLENIKNIFISYQRMRSQTKERLMSIKQIIKDYDILFNYNDSEAYMAIKMYKRLESVTPKKEQIKKLLEDLDAKIISSIEETKSLNPQCLKNKTFDEFALHEINSHQIDSSIAKAGEQFNNDINKMIKDLGHEVNDTQKEDKRKEQQQQQQKEEEQQQQKEKEKEKEEQQQKEKEEQQQKEKEEEQKEKEEEEERKEKEEERKEKEEQQKEKEQEQEKEEEEEEERRKKEDKKKTMEAEMLHEIARKNRKKRGKKKCYNLS